MKRRLLTIILLSVSILSSGCSSSKIQGSNSDASSVVESSSTVTSVKQKDYSVYTGSWAQEENIKSDFLYGLVMDITVDQEGNLTGKVGDSTENASHIANIDIKGKIENNKFSGTFDEDGWKHKGTVILDFSEESITITLKYGDGSSKENLWGIGEGTFKLIKSDTKISSSLDDLKNGGLQVIENQVFSLDLNDFGKIKFISGLKRENSSEVAKFYLIDNKNSVLYKFPDFYGNSKGRFAKINAVSFQDVNKDGLKDIIIIGEFTVDGKNEVISSIYLQKSKAFSSNVDFDEKLNKSGNNKEVSAILKYAKDNLE